MNQSEKVYKNIKALCKRNHEYMRDIEKMAGVSTGYISRTARDKNISLYHANRIAGHFGVTIDDLMNKDFYSGVAREDVDGIINTISKALEDTEFATAKWKKAGPCLAVFIERRVSDG